MLNKRINKYIRGFAAGLACTMLVPGIAFAAEDTAVATETVTEAAEEAVPTPTPSLIETNNLPEWPQGPEINSRTACLMDANTGAVLYNKSMTEKMYPASTTKVLTALLAIENSSLDEVVVFTETGVAEAYSGSSNLNTKVGEEFTMEECLYALMLKSANDFASQIAEHVGGSVEGFCQMMNDRAAAIGCVNTHFNNAHGMPDENHYTCAYDLALIMREALKNETFRTVAATRKFEISDTALSGKRTVTSHNELINEGPYYFEGCLGGKTGYTDSAMNTFVSGAERNGVTLIEVTMFSPSSADSFMNAKTLYEYGFNNFTNHVVEEGSHIYSGGSITLPNGMAADRYTGKDGEVFSTSFGNMMWRYFYYEDHKVGEVAVTEESYLEEQRLLEEIAQKMEEQKALEEQRLDDLKKNVLSEPMLEPISKELFTVSHIIIGVFIVLIGLGIIAIVVTLIVKSLRKRRKRRR